METQTPDTPATPAVPLDPRQVLQTMLDGLGLLTKVEQFPADGMPLLHIATAEPGRLIGKHGQTLSQLQFLLNRILQRADKNAPRVIVDCERYRDRQNDELIRHAIAAGERARRWGEPVHIGPFSAMERRVIHQHFQNDRELEAISEGEEDGGRKKMTVRVRQAPAPAPRPAAPPPA
jgi:spoIIIJ-associated protein